MSLPGPDVLTSCGNPQALLKINEQYVVGVGTQCESIGAWSTLQSYSANELQQLRDLSENFENGRLTCGAGALGFVPSLFLIITVATFVISTA